jgi:hypothetical protein
MREIPKMHTPEETILELLKEAASQKARWRDRAVTK